MKSLYSIFSIVIISSVISPLMAECTGNACYITLGHPSFLKVKSSIHKDIRHKNFFNEDVYLPIITTFFMPDDINQYCQFDETVVIVTRDTFECVEDISTWIKV